MAERSGYLGLGVVIIVFGLLLLAFKSCIDDENNQKLEKERKRREFEEKQPKPSNYKNPKFFPRYKHQLSKVIQVKGSEWKVFLTPHTVDFTEYEHLLEDPSRGNFTDFQSKYQGNYAAFTDGKDHGWVRILKDIPQGEYATLASQNGLKFYYKLYQNCMYDLPEVYCGTKCETYNWDECARSYKYCVGSNTICGISIRVSEDSRVLAGNVTITRKPLPNYN